MSSEAKPTDSINTEEETAVQTSMYCETVDFFSLIISSDVVKPQSGTIDEVKLEIRELPGDEVPPPEDGHVSYAHDSHPTGALTVYPSDEESDIQHENTSSFMDALHALPREKFVRLRPIRVLSHVPFFACTGRSL